MTPLSEAAPVARRSTIEASEAGRFGDASHTEHVGRGPHRNPALLRDADDVREGPPHDGLELLVHLVLGPEVTRQILHPLEVGDGDAARVRENVWNQEDTILVKDRVRF